MTLATLLIYLNATSVALISVRNITKWFVSGDIIALIMQAAGAGVQAAVQARRQIGSDIVIAGIAAQILFFGAFVVVTMVADHRLRASKFSSNSSGRFSWRALLYSLYVASLLILIRSIFRVIEFQEGYRGFVDIHEIFFYVFDTLLMFAVMANFAVFHPGLILVGPYVAPSTT